MKKNKNLFLILILSAIISLFVSFMIKANIKYDKVDIYRITSKRTFDFKDSEIRTCLSKISFEDLKFVEFNEQLKKDKNGPLIRKNAFSFQPEYRFGSLIAEVKNYENLTESLKFLENRIKYLFNKSLENKDNLNCLSKNLTSIFSNQIEKINIYIEALEKIYDQKFEKIDTNLIISNNDNKKKLTYEDILLAIEKKNNSHQKINIFDCFA